MSRARLTALVFGVVLVVAITVFAATRAKHAANVAPPPQAPAVSSAPSAPSAAVPARDGGAALDAGVAAGAVPENPQLVARGADLYRSQACSTCHTLNGAQSTGPSFLGLYGSTQKLRDGSTVTVDDAYLRESILNSNVRVVDGFLPLMPNYANRLDDADVDALVAWIKSVK